MTDFKGGSSSTSEQNTADTAAVEANLDHIKCDICQEQRALCYCVDCEQKLCDGDFKVSMGTASIGLGVGKLQKDQPDREFQGDPYHYNYCFVKRALYPIQSQFFF